MQQLNIHTSVRAPPYLQPVYATAWVLSLSARCTRTINFVNFRAREVEAL